MQWQTISLILISIFILWHIFNANETPLGQTNDQASTVYMPDIVTTPMPSSHGTLDDMNAMPTHMDTHTDAAYGRFDMLDGSSTPMPTPSPEMTNDAFGATSLPTATFSTPW